MSVDVKVPEIRFEGFSGDWDTCRLDEAATVERGKFSVRPRNDPRYFGGSIPFVQTGDIVSANRRLKRFSQTLNEKGLSVSRSFPKNTILMTIAANIGDLAITDFSVACPDSVVAINANDNFNTAFLFDFLGMKKVDLEAVATTNAQANINLKILNPLKVVVPTFKEQTKIGNTFQKLDSLINQHLQKHDKLSSIKKAMLEKMFPKQGENIPEIRFKGFSGEWEGRSLFEEAVVSTGFPFDSTDFSGSGDLLVITNGNIQNSSSTVDGKVGNRIARGKVTSLSQHILNIGDILVTMDGSVGRTAKVIDTSQILAQRVGRLVAKGNTEFLYQSLNTGAFLDSMTTISHGGTIKHISLSEIGSHLLLVPESIDEQEKIGDYLQKLDALINQHQQQITKLNNIKQACLSKMFV